MREVAIETLDAAGLAADAALGRALLAVNNAHAVELSWLADGRLETLVGQAFWAGRVGAEAFMLTFDQDAAYDSVNFQWFRARFERFVYVDRIVVGDGLRRRGVARALYAAAVARAEAAGHERVVCEVNTEPANPASAAMHAAMGFRPVGTGSPMAGKQVAYLELSLA